MTRRHFTLQLLFQARFDVLPSRSRFGIARIIFKFAIQQRFFFVGWIYTAAQQLLFFQLPDSISNFSQVRRIKLRQLFQNLGFAHGYTFS